VFPALGETYVAWRGGGATLGGRPLRVRVPRPPADTAILACCSRTPRWHHVNLPMKIRVFGAATWSLACVARGSAAICYETRAKVWDLAAGWCVVEEAGGVVEAIGGRRPFPLDASVDFATMDFPVLAAASPGLAAQAREHIEPR